MCRGGGVGGQFQSDCIREAPERIANQQKGEQYVPTGGNQHDTFKNLKESVYVGAEREVE